MFSNIENNSKNEIDNINILIGELPDLMFERMKEFLNIKLQIVIKGKFRKFIPSLAREEFEELTIASKNRIILREDEIDETITALLTEIKEKNRILG